jgi:CHAT domain-containing protein
MFLQAQASEATFKAAWRPRVAVLSTHGFFLNPTASGSSKGTSSQNPLLRCGLVLSGANQPRALTQNAQDDGIVTGLDVLETDLRGTELVVLSACETALGEISASEGVAGLRQAFQLSGARSVVATLWRIPDDETAQLMKTFFDRLAAGADKATALQQAQQSLLAPKGKAATDTSHPFFWAAFTLTGDWRVPEVGKPEPRPERRLPGAQVEVVVESARLMKEDAVVLTVARGDRLTSGKVEGDWIEVFYEPGTTKTAWIHKSKVRDVK